MRKIYSAQKITRLYQRFQFHISAFILAVMGIWLLWEIRREPVVPDWVFYLAGVWALLLTIELFRFMYVFNTPRKIKNK
ncbi:MAG: hypothetical protein DI535_17865 [Citrobacter freundii]|nr:MAG: hypothetical protein DI535_17865 [Citrobacter freundii]